MFLAEYWWVFLIVSILAAAIAAFMQFRYFFGGGALVGMAKKIQEQQAEEMDLEGMAKMGVSVVTGFGRSMLPVFISSGIAVICFLLFAVGLILKIAT